MYFISIQNYQGKPKILDMFQIVSTLQKFQHWREDTILSYLGPSGTKYIQSALTLPDPWPPFYHTVWAFHCFASHSWVSRSTCKERCTCCCQEIVGPAYQTLTPPNKSPGSCTEIGCSQLLSESRVDMESWRFVRGRCFYRCKFRSYNFLSRVLHAPLRCLAMRSKREFLGCGCLPKSRIPPLTETEKTGLQSCRSCSWKWSLSSHCAYLQDCQQINKILSKLDESQNDT